ncbi:MAG TPA: hypothetical protein VF625_17395 [Longimicrobium sp.]
MSVQLESRHFYNAGVEVQHVLGGTGKVAESFALWAVVRWDDGRQEEVDQLDPAIWVVERASRE